MTHELIKGYNRKHLSPRWIIQIDLQKANDIVNWHALELIMIELSFPDKFVVWIMIVVRIVSYRYLINGQINDLLKAKRGLRHEDSVSPLVFVLVMEYLNRCLAELQTQACFKYHPRCARLKITHLCFVDDLMLFARGKVFSIRLMMIAFNKFSTTTGLRANPNKCQVFFGGVCMQDQLAMLEETGFAAGILPIKYLRVPLASIKLTIAQCQPLIDKMVKRIQHWSVKLHSYAGRKQLVSNVLMSISGYWMNVFPIPKKVIAKIESICRNFLWSAKAKGRKSLVAWNNVCDPRNAGGLNLRKLHSWNKALILKLLWKIHSKANKH